MHSNVMFNPNIAAIFGALIADSAALGLHWLYDPDRIAKIEVLDGLIFLQPNASNYTDTKGFFAHANKKSGDASGMGSSWTGGTDWNSLCWSGIKSEPQPMII